MNKSKYIFQGLLSALGTAVYVVIVVWVISNAQKIFNQANDFSSGLFMIMLFVISALISGLIVLGRPAHLYLSGSKREAVILLLSTLAWLILFFLILTFILLLM